MKAVKTTDKIARLNSWAIGLILALLPFHAFLTVWGSSGLGHYTLLRLWKEFLLSLVALGTLYILARDAGLRHRLTNSWLIRLIGIYTALLLLSGLIAFERHTVNAKALAYGELLDLRFLGFFLLVLVAAAKSKLLRQNWRELLLIPGLIVITFGLLQYWLLPYDFLKHFGYGPATISPYETINHNVQHLRIESTLRGANPLGAYLVLIISVLGAILTTAKNHRWKKLVLGVAAFLALILTYSRSAGIGLLLSLAIILWLSIKSDKYRQRLLIVAGVFIVLGCLLAFGLRNNTTFQDDILHTDSHSTIAISSNQGHSSAFKSGIHDVVHQPLGEGPGSAGPASFYNNHPARIAENYFLQIGQEAGLIGMVLFIIINVMVGRLLYQRRSDPLALALLASLVGLSFVNLLSHAWTDDTLAYVWWGLAAIALSPAILEHKSNKHGKAQIRPKT